MIFGCPVFCIKHKEDSINSGLYTKMISLHHVNDTPETHLSSFSFDSITQAGVSFTSRVIKITTYSTVHLIQLHMNMMVGEQEKYPSYNRINFN